MPLRRLYAYRREEENRLIIHSVNLETVCGYTSRLPEHQVPEISRYLYSFIVYILISRNGLNNGGQPYFDYSEEEIEQLYTGYSPDYLPESVIQWVEDGILDEDRISADIGQRIQKDELSAVCTEGAEK